MRKPGRHSAGQLGWNYIAGCDACCTCCESLNRYLILDEVPVEAVELVERHHVQKLLDKGQGEVVAPAVQQHPAPQEARRIHNLRSRMRMPFLLVSILAR